jgi:hypothetical protein
MISRTSDNQSWPDGVAIELEEVTPVSRLHCDMKDTCTDPVTHIGNKGYLYCAKHAAHRSTYGSERTRKMTRLEISKVEDGDPISYRNTPKFVSILEQAQERA